MALILTNFSRFNQSNFSLTDGEIGGLAYFLVYISDYLPYVVLSAMGTILGIFGNVLIISAVICCKELHSSTNILVFNLALADLTISGFVDSFTVLGVFLGKNYFDERPALCQLIGAICLIACETSLVNIGFLAVNRYINICYHQHYKKIFSVKKTLFYCAITWMIGILIDVPNVTGWGGHFYDPKTLNCVWDRLASQSYSIFFPMSSIVIPCIIILICYMRIFLFAYSSKNKVAASGADHMVNFANTQTQITVAPCVKTTTTLRKTTDPDHHKLSTHIYHKFSPTDFSRSLRIAKGLFASFMLFTVCWLPYGMIVMTDYADKLPRTAHMFSMEIAHLNSSFNPVLYAIFNPAFQRGYMLVFRMIFRKRPSSRDTKSSSAVPSGTRRKFKTATHTGHMSQNHEIAVISAIKS